MEKKEIKSEKGVGFKFLNYKIPTFRYSEDKKNDGNYDINFIPSGIYYSSKGVYELRLEFKAINKTGEEVMSVVGIALYKFDDLYRFEQLPSHFFLSAIPIFFPYMRAFVSNLTLQANNTRGVLVLGLINFTNMADPLKTNTTIVSD